MKHQDTTGDNEFNTGTSGIDRIGKTNVFQTPEGYFEKFPGNLADHIHAAPSNRNFISSRLYVLAVTAMIAVIAGVLYFVNFTGEKASDPQLTSQEIIDSGVLAEMDEFILVEAFQIEFNQETGITDSDSLAGITDFEDYLIENNTDISLIINEL